ncbi:MAG: hypothetical protein ABIA04_10500 [Pseudomonadota bacterium]
MKYYEIYLLLCLFFSLISCGNSNNILDVPVLDHNNIQITDEIFVESAIPGISNAEDDIISQEGINNEDSTTVPSVEVYVSNDQDIIDHSDPAIPGSLAQVIASLEYENQAVAVLEGEHQYSIIADFEIPENISLRIDRGSVLSIEPGVSFIVNGSLEAGPYQIFDIDYASYEKNNFPVLGEKTAIDKVYVEWFGITNDAIYTRYSNGQAFYCSHEGQEEGVLVPVYGRDNQPAIQAAIDFAISADISTVAFATSGKYGICSTIQFGRGYRYSSLILEGVTSAANDNGVEILAGFGNMPALAVNGMQNGIIRSIKFQGINYAPEDNGYSLESTTAEADRFINPNLEEWILNNNDGNFEDHEVIDDQYVPYAGIAIDPFLNTSFIDGKLFALEPENRYLSDLNNYNAESPTCSASNADTVCRTSTNIELDHVTIEHFVVGYMRDSHEQSATGATDRISQSTIRNNTYGVSIGHPNSNSILLDTCSISKNYIMVTTTRHGGRNGDTPTIINTTSCLTYRLFEISSSGTTGITGGRYESFIEFGQITGGLFFANGVDFDFAYGRYDKPSDDPDRRILNPAYRFFIDAPSSFTSTRFSIVGDMLNMPASDIVSFDNSVFIPQIENGSGSVHESFILSSAKDKASYISVENSVYGTNSPSINTASSSVSRFDSMKARVHIQPYNYQFIAGSNQGIYNIVDRPSYYYNINILENSLIVPEDTRPGAIFQFEVQNAEDLLIGDYIYWNCTTINSSNDQIEENLLLALKITAITNNGQTARIEAESLVNGIDGAWTLDSATINNINYKVTYGYRQAMVFGGTYRLGNVPGTTSNGSFEVNNIDATSINKFYIGDWIFSEAHPDGARILEIDDGGNYWDISTNVITLSKAASNISDVDTSIEIYNSLIDRI